MNDQLFQNGGIEQSKGQTRLVDAKGLLSALFDKSCRPSVRWLREQQRKNAIPFVRIGRLVFFDIERVKAALFGPAPASIAESNR